VEAFFSSLALVAVAEMGDKTQLLSFLLAARFPRRATPLLLGILAATLLNHWVAAAVGGWVAQHVSAQAVRWSLGGAFLVFALWALKPDTLDADEAPRSGHSAFFTALVAFFVAEMGDKTQFATVALGAHYAHAVAAVVVGTTLGMMAANVPAVLLGDRLAQRVPLQRMRYLASGLFALFGLLVLLDVGTVLLQ